MILLLVGLVCFALSLLVTRRGPDAAARDVRGGGAAAWMALLGLLVLLQLAVGRNALDGYRLTLLGFRFDLAAVEADGLEVGGSHVDADLWVPGAGDRPVARLRPDSAGGVRAEAMDDPGAVALVEEPTLLGVDWRVLGARRVEPGDTVVVGSGADAVRLLASTVPDTLGLGGLHVPLPWVREHVVRRAGPAGGGTDGPAVLLPGVERGVLARLRPFHPSVFQRTYPLADVVAGLDPSAAAALPRLSSFMFYRDGGLHLADLDAEVEVSGAAAEAVPVPAGRRLLVAGLPLRDYPEPDLRLPERYGVRPLRSFRLEVHGTRLDAALTSPEVRSLDRAELENLRLPGARGEDGTPQYRVRLASAQDAMARRAVVFDAAPARFAVPGQAILSLPAEPTEGALEVLTPAGLARWETGRPLTLGTGPRELLVRVDGQGTSAAYWWIHAALLAMPVLLVLLRPVSGLVLVLALTAAGLGAFRLVLSLSALAAPPHLIEAQQLALWLLPWLPWAVVVGAEAGRGATVRREGPPVRRGEAFHAAYALALVGLAAVLFPGAGAKAVALSALALGTAGAWLAVRRGAVDVRRFLDAVAAWAARHPGWLRGWSLGLVLLAVRALLEVLGFREQIMLGGTRIGVSVVYTPMVLAALAVVLARAARELGETRGTDDFPAAVARTLLDTGAFLLLALVGVSVWISDFGIALALLPGALTLLALLGWRWAPGGRWGGLTVASLALPLLVFSLIQAAPTLLRFAWGGDVQTADARMDEWNRNELLLLERGDPAGLRMIGQRRSEALAVMRETMRSYTRGNAGGKGFLRGHVSGAVAETATREHAVSALLASQFGLPGTVGLVLLLLALLPPGVELLFRGSGRTDEMRRAGAGPAGRGASAGALVVGLVVLATGAFLLPSPFDALFVGLAVAGALIGLVAPALGRPGWWSRGGPDRGGVGSRYGAEAPPASRRHDPGPGTGGGWTSDLRPLLAAAALLGLSLAGLYMVLANYGLVFFTGKNVYGLGLDSLGDALETTALLLMAAVALGMERGGTREGSGPGGVAVDRATEIWWHPSDGPKAEEGAGGGSSADSGRHGKLTGGGRR